MSTGGWDDTTEGWESTSLTWGTGPTVTAEPHGKHMGLAMPYGPPDNHRCDIAVQAGVRMIGWGLEPPDYMSTPDSTSSYGTIDTASIQAIIDNVHAHTTPWGQPLGICLTILGVPRAVNPNAGSADPASGGNWHWFATDSAGRTKVNTFTVAIASLLDPELDEVMLGNETMNSSFNHNGTTTLGPGEPVGADAATVAAQQAEQILALRSACPGLKIRAGCTMNFGDMNNPADTATGLVAPDWLAAMILADPRLAGTGADARPDYWDHHNYTGSTSPLDGITISSGITSITPGGPGWASPQMLKCRDVLRFLGVTAPDGSEPKMSIGEYGYHRQGVAFDGSSYTEATQLAGFQQALFLYEVWKQEGWLTGSQNAFTHSDETGEFYGLWRDTAPYAPYTAGTYFTSWAHTLESPPPPTEVAPVAAFTVTPNPVYVGDVANFADTSTNDPTSWSWDFGDGSGTFTTQNPTHTYTTVGTYTVTFTATNDFGSDTHTTTITVSPFVVTSPPVDPDDLDVVIEIGVPAQQASSLLNSGAFRLEAATGVLDSGGGLADRYIWWPVTADAVEVSTDRGCRDGMTRRAEVGTASVTLRDDNPGTARQYDPTNAIGRFWPYLGPRARMRIQVDGCYIFGGDIESTPTTDTVGNQVVTTINLVEASNRLAQKKLSYRPEALHTAAQRIHRILERAGWEEESFLFTGVNQYARGALLEGDAWTLIQDVAFSEGGMAYISQQGNSLNFIDREHMLAPSLELMSDLPNAQIPYDDVTRASGMDILVNRAVFTAIANDKWKRTAHDNTSIGEYGEVPLEFTTPIGGDDRAATRYLMAFRTQQLVNDYKRPIPRFDTVTIEARKLGKQVRRPFVIGQEIGHVVTVERHPPGSGWPPVISQTCVILGMSFSVTPNSCIVTFRLTPRLS